MLMMRCKTCEHILSANAEICPQCGEPDPHYAKALLEARKRLLDPRVTRIIPVVFVIVVLFNWRLPPIIAFLLPIFADIGIQVFRYRCVKSDLECLREYLQVGNRDGDVA